MTGNIKHLMKHFHPKNIVDKCGILIAVLICILLLITEGYFPALINKEWYGQAFVLSKQL